VFLGLDISLTGTGLTIINKDYSIKKMELLSVPVIGTERLVFLETKFIDLLKDEEIVLACIEGPAYKETGKIFQIGELTGIFKINLFKLGIDNIIAVPLQLKKYISGVGKSITKQLIILDIYKNFNVEIRDDNLADAYGLARIAHDYYYRYILNESLSIKKYQEDVLSKIYSTNQSEKKATLL